MNPLANEIWIYIILAYGLVSVTMWIVARFSPFEWHITKPTTCSNYSADRMHGRREQSRCKCDDKANNKSRQRNSNSSDNNSSNRDDDNESDSSEKRSLLSPDYVDTDNSENDVLIYERATNIAGDVNASHRHTVECNEMESQIAHNEQETVAVDTKTVTTTTTHRHNGSHECNEDSCDYHGQYDDVIEEGHNCDFVDCDGFQATELLCSENDFTLKNSFWFTIGTLMQQGSDLNPKVERTTHNFVLSTAHHFPLHFRFVSFICLLFS